jgi:N-alpha-acetyl-L-2,4-diaminobutyrate deacetylase
LPVEAEDQGKVVITTELGGGGRVPEPVHRLAWSGLNNVLRHVGLLEGEVDTRASLGLADAVIIDGRDPTNYVIAEETGLFEGLKEPGETVSGGEPVGRLWFPDQLGRDPVPLVAPRDGIVACIRAVPVTEAGNSVFTIGQPISKDDLLEP